MSDLTSSYRDADSPRLSDSVLHTLRDAYSDAAAHAVAAIRSEVPAYMGTLSVRKWAKIQRGVALSLNGFIEAAEGSRSEADALSHALQAAYELGRGEAQAGRAVEGLQAAFRVGSRAAWARIGDALLKSQVGAGEIVFLAGAIFAYADRLATASASGHSTQIDAAIRDRLRLQIQLASLLLSDSPRHQLDAAAEQAQWAPPETLTAVLIPTAHAEDVRAWINSRSLAIEDDHTLTLLVPDVDGSIGRDQLMTTLRGRHAVVGPPRPWREVAQSHQRAARLLDLVQSGTVVGDPADTELHLAALVAHADAASLDDLRAQVLAPLAALQPSARERMESTLRSWLLYSLADKRQEQVAKELFVHPQTIRYRVARLRELFGDRLQDPTYVRDLILALV